MKHDTDIVGENGLPVAPFTGAWIETFPIKSVKAGPNVAPFTGAWIETPIDAKPYVQHFVAPFTGAWIETLLCICSLQFSNRRTLYGCVD